MANRATVTYNGAIISTEDKDGSFAVVYNGNTLATLGAGQSKTLNCSGQPMKTDIVIGEKTLRCKNLKMHTDILIAVASLFPSAPSAYNLIGTYTSSQTWTAPEDGYFQVELFGASGNGAMWNSGSGSTIRGGGGGGGGGYVCSRIKMNKGDTIVLTAGAIGEYTYATINSSLESYTQMSCRSGVGSSSSSGGVGGMASGGNYANTDGGQGSAGESGNMLTGAKGGAGGIGANGAPNGGNGGSKKGLSGGTDADPTMGSPGFFKIYSGNTNNVITPVNYIQSTGTEYIDTLIQLSTNSIPNFRVVADIELIKAAGVWCVSGSGVTFPIVHFGVNGNGIYSCGNGTTDLAFEDTYIQKRCIWDYDIKGKTFTVDGVKRGDFVIDLNGSGSKNFYISAYANGSGATCHSEKIYGYKFYSNGTLIRDFIPCTNASGIAGLYDRVEGKFYGNAGSGSFITG